MPHHVPDPRDRLTKPDRQMLFDLRRLRWGSTDRAAAALRALRYRVLIPIPTPEGETWDPSDDRPEKIARMETQLHRLMSFRRLMSRAETRDAGTDEPRLTEERLLRLNVTPERFVGLVVALDDEELGSLLHISRGGHSTKGLRWRRPEG